MASDQRDFHMIIFHKPMGAMFARTAFVCEVSEPAVWEMTMRYGWHQKYCLFGEDVQFGCLLYLILMWKPLL